ncbi:hypothetical protein ACO1O0_005387 [Amphichorda felina]
MDEPANSFTCFTRLSPEIRASIWKTALWTPTIVQLCFDAEFPDGSKMHLNHRVIPPLLHVSSESRRYAQEVYPDVFADQKATALMTYMNLEIDTLYIGTANKDMEFEWIAENFALRDVRSLDMDDVKHFAFDVGFWRHYGTENFLRLLSSFAGLKSLILVIEDDLSSPDAPAKLVGLDEKELGQETAGLGYSAAGKPDGPLAYRDVAASIQTAYEKLLADEGDAHYFEDWSLPELRVERLVGKILGRQTKENLTPSRLVQSHIDDTFN